MVRWKISIVALGLLLCGALAVAKLVANPVAGEVLTVKVQDAAGRPLRACITVISPDHQVVNFCQVDHDGVTEIPNLNRQKYRVSAKSSGYVMEQKEIDLGTGENQVSFTLQPKS
jgi:hypothetical protein